MPRELSENEFSDLEMAIMLTEAGFDVDLYDTSADNDTDYDTNLVAEMAINEGYDWDDLEQYWY